MSAHIAPVGIAQIRHLDLGTETTLGSGIVIGPRRVLTAHHVVAPKEHGSAKLRSADTVQVRVAGQTFQVENIIESAGGRSGHLNDVALLTLKEDIPSEQTVTVMQDAGWYLSRWQNTNEKGTFYGRPLNDDTVNAYQVEVRAGWSG